MSVYQSAPDSAPDSDFAFLRALFARLEIGAVTLWRGLAAEAVLLARPDDGWP
jgi:hypothetical protein